MSDTDKTTHSNAILLSLLFANAEVPKGRMTINDAPRLVSVCINATNKVAVGFRCLSSSGHRIESDGRLERGAPQSSGGRR